MGQIDVLQAEIDEQRALKTAAQNKAVDDRKVLDKQLEVKIAIYDRNIEVKQAQIVALTPAPEPAPDSAPDSAPETPSNG